MNDSVKQAIRYLIVGGWNTIFGIAIYWLFVWVLEGTGRFGYMIAALLSNVVAVTESFITYKFLVFRTRGHWIAEYLKCWGVYGGASLINLVCLPFCVEATRWLLPVEWERYAPYVGGLGLTGITIILSFIGHKKITFKNYDIKK